MTRYRLTVVDSDGHGETHGWGDAYEVDAPDYEAAKANVLGRAGTDGKARYARVVKAWQWDDYRCRWEELYASKK